MGLCLWCDGLCWRWARRNRFWSFRSRICHGSWEATREDDAQFPPSQCLLHPPRNCLPLVWLARLQRWIFFWCQPESYHGLLEHEYHCNFCCHYLGSHGFQTSQKMVNGRLVLWHYLRSCRGHPCFWLYRHLGKCGIRSYYRSACQLGHER